MTAMPMMIDDEEYVTIGEMKEMISKSSTLTGRSLPGLGASAAATRRRKSRSMARSPAYSGVPKNVWKGGSTS
jgi:hypothetical protein